MKTHCKHGHEFTPENTYLRLREGRKPTRQCRACNNEVSRRKRAKTRVIAGIGRQIIDPLDRVIARIVIAPTGCWLWQSTLDHNGYARIWTRGKQRLAHRVVYERVHGRPIQDGLCLDHLCRVRHCVNPKHLEPVTFEENVSRGAKCRCGSCAKCLRNAYMREWTRRRRAQGLPTRSQPHASPRK